MNTYKTLLLMVVCTLCAVVVFGKPPTFKEIMEKSRQIKQAVQNL